MPYDDAIQAATRKDFAMQNIRLLVVGRLKAPHCKAAAEYYARRLAHSFTMEECLARDGDASLPPARRNVQEGERLLKLLRPADHLVCLDEGGQLMTSPQFAAFLRGLHENGSTAAFVLGGAHGLSPQVLDRARLRLSLSPMTFPHELARVLLLEQLYRAAQILANTGYHH